MNQVIAAIKFLLKAYFGGCFGCLGVLSAVIALIVLFGLTLGPQVLSALQGIQLPPLPIPSGPGVPPGEPPGGFPSGPPGSPGTMTTPAPTPTGPLPQLAIWATTENRVDAPSATTVKIETNRLYVWVKGPKGASVSFDVWITMPTGKKERFGPTGVFVTNSDGSPMSAGSMTDLPPMKGIFKLEAVIGTTVVGSTTITVQ
jgi:hypothetical protein